MRSSKFIWKRIPVTTKYKYKIILLIGLGWTVIDLLYLWTRIQIPYISPGLELFNYSSVNAVLLRIFIVFATSSAMASVLFFQFRRNTMELPLGLNFLLKTGVLVVLAFFMNFLIYMAYSIVLQEQDFGRSLSSFAYYAFDTTWLAKKIPGWLLAFSLLQVIAEMIKKYSPGIFFDILLGKYQHPKLEKRIVMFIDLKDSTPIAEKLGHSSYFMFIRQFIEVVSIALIQHRGRIYQYVGDEVVVSWICNPKNAKHCIASLIETRKRVQQREAQFKRQFGVAPEFRVGIHIGEVMVGEIGILKKDIAMSGDTMNTTARIRSACGELNQKFIVSKDVIETMDLKNWQSESLGVIDLKGKKAGIELFALKI